MLLYPFSLLNGKAKAYDTVSSTERLILEETGENPVPSGYGLENKGSSLGILQSSKPAFM